MARDCVRGAFSYISRLSSNKQPNKSQRSSKKGNRKLSWCCWNKRKDPRSLSIFTDSSAPSVIVFGPFFHRPRIIDCKGQRNAIVNNQQYVGSPSSHFRSGHAESALGGGRRFGRGRAAAATIVVRTLPRAPPCPAAAAANGGTRSEQWAWSDDDDNADK